MAIDIFKFIFRAFLIMAIQVIVLNNIHLFGCATPLLLVYILIMCPGEMPRWASLTLGFVLGIISDTFCNTPGVAAAALTFVAFIQPSLFGLFIPRDSQEEIQPTMTSMGITKYMFYSFVITLTFCILFYSLQQFSFFNIEPMLLAIAGSTLLTYIIIIAIEIFRKG